MPPRIAKPEPMGQNDSITSQFRLLTSRFEGEDLALEDATLVTLVVGEIVSGVMKRQLEFKQMRSLMKVLARFAKKNVSLKECLNSSSKRDRDLQTQQDYANASDYIISLFRVCNMGDPIEKSAIEIRSHFLEEVRIHNETWSRKSLDVENDFIPS